MKCDKGCVYYGHCQTDEDCEDYRPECGCNLKPQKSEAVVPLNDLLACPFCGEAPYLYKSRTQYTVLHTCIVEAKIGFHKKAEAIRIWNQRAC